MIYEYKNCKYNDSGTIDCEINHPKYGWIPFTACNNDAEDHGKETYQQIIADNQHIEAYAPPVYSDAELANMVRNQRTSLLTNSDWTQLPDVPAQTRQNWSVYRQALRDISQQQGFPQNVNWPHEPA